MNIIPMLAWVTMTGGGLGQGLILLVAAIIVLAFLVWINNNYVPEPMRKWGMLVIVLLCVLALLNLVLSFNGGGFVRW